MAYMGKMDLAKLAPNHPLAHTQIVFGKKPTSGQKVPPVEVQPTTADQQKADSKIKQEPDAG